MEEDQKEKFKCKYCNKNFKNGRSLGGHMRGHLAMIATKKHEDQIDHNMGFEDNGQTSYGLRPIFKKISRVSDSNNGDSEQENLKNNKMDHGLRENPKKSWKASDPRIGTSKKIENICKQCGKGFKTLRALSGHMRCHTIKEREENICKQCGKKFDSIKAMFGHMRSHSKRSRVSNESVDCETVCPIRRKRSRMRYKIATNSSFTNEVEEVAMCLIMLSRGVRKWGEFNSVTESSDNNSVTSEANKSSNRSDGVAQNDGDESWKMKKSIGNLDSCVLVSGNSAFQKNVSELGDYDENKVELEVSVDGFFKNVEIKKPKLDDESRIEFCDAKIEEGIEFLGAQMERDLKEKVGFEKNLSKLGNFHSDFTKSDDEKKVEFEVSVDGCFRNDEIKKATLDDESRIELCDTEVEKGIEFLGAEVEKDLKEEIGFDQADLELIKFNNAINNTSCEIEILKNSQKKCEYKCRTCEKVFQSYRALGGHQNCHKRIKNTFQKNPLSVIEANSKLEQELNENDELKKSKDYECSICFKVFQSGQALGGHKRAHFAGFSDGRDDESISLDQELHEIDNMFDLNIPVNLEKETSEDVKLNLWWFGSDHEREPLVISN